jgi:hypothetical protein
MLIKTLEPGTKDVLVHHMMSQYFVGRNLELAYQDLDENTRLRCLSIHQLDAWIKEFDLTLTQQGQAAYLEMQKEDKNWPFYLLQEYSDFSSEIENAIENELWVNMNKLDKLLNSGATIEDVKQWALETKREMFHDGGVED